jgi:hypothetical protein
VTDYTDLIARLRGPVKHPQQSVTFRLEAADALEAKDKEIAKLVSDLKTAVWSDSVECKVVNKENEKLRARIAELEAELFTLKFVRSEMTSGLLAKIMWDAYCVQAGGKTFDGKPLPTWDELGEERQGCWLAAADAARAAYLGEKDDDTMSDAEWEQVSQLSSKV